MGVHQRDDDRGSLPPAGPAPFGFEVEVVTDPAGTVRCRPRGDMDLASSELLGAAVTEALAARPAALVIDLAGIGFFDSSGLNVLLRARLDAADAGVPLALAAPSPAVERVFELTGAGEVFTVRATA